jgi:hypothetical protein
VRESEAEEARRIIAEYLSAGETQSPESGKDSGQTPED